MEPEILKELHKVDKEMVETKVLMNSIKQTVEALNTSLESHMADEITYQRALHQQFEELKSKVSILWLVGSIIGGLALTVAGEFLLRKLF